jgi:Phage integrase, N-terminal SAM-like domain
VIDLTLLGTWIRRFLLEHLVAERNLALNTQRSYRDTLVLLIPFVAKKAGKAVDRLSVVDMSAELIRLFLADLETSRRCAIVTRNQRLAAIHALARFVGEHSPEHIAWCAQLRAIPFKKPTVRAVIPYLDKSEMDALLAAPDGQTAQGRRDQALILFLYNSAGKARGRVYTKHKEAGKSCGRPLLSKHIILVFFLNRCHFHRYGAPNSRGFPRSLVSCPESGNRETNDFPYKALLREIHRAVEQPT